MLSTFLSCLFANLLHEPVEHHSGESDTIYVILILIFECLLCIVVVAACDVNEFKCISFSHKMLLSIHRLKEFHLFVSDRKLLLRHMERIEIYKC